MLRFRLCGDGNAGFSGPLFFLCEIKTIFGKHVFFVGDTERVVGIKRVEPLLYGDDVFIDALDLQLSLTLCVDYLLFSNDSGLSDERLHVGQTQVLDGRV